VLLNHQLLRLGLPPVIVMARAENRQADYCPLLDRYATTDDHAGLTNLVGLLLAESLHKRLALLTGRRVVPLPAWAKAVGLNPDPPNLDCRATPNGRIGGVGDSQKTSSLNRAADAATTPVGCRSPRRSSVDQG